LDDFRAGVARQAPFVADRIGALQSWDDVKLLTVQVDRLKKWYAPGLLFIGDAAHAMSPIVGVGINLAVQDAVAAANILYPDLAAEREPDLAAVQKRRTFPTVMTQGLQLLIQNTFMARILRDSTQTGNHKHKPPAFLQAFKYFPPLRRVLLLFLPHHQTARCAVRS